MHNCLVSDFVTPKNTLLAKFVACSLAFTAARTGFYSYYPDALPV